MAIALSVPLEKGRRSPSPLQSKAALNVNIAHSREIPSKDSHSRDSHLRDSHSRGGARPHHSTSSGDHNSHPATPVRASPAVGTGSRPGTMESHQNKDDKDPNNKRRRSIEGARRMSFDADKTTTGAMGEEGFYEINRNLRKLEQRAWDSLICNTPEEVVQKLLCEECHAALDSAVAFATDSNAIWMPMQDTSEEKGWSYVVILLV